jgi:steroid 5-alpha reductase family enzyme
MNKKTSDLLKLTAIYLFIWIVGLVVVLYFIRQDKTQAFLLADLSMTVLVFGFSLVFRNSSVYDAYWSVIPFYFVTWWLLIYVPFLTETQYLVLGLISIWSWRLTLNWMRSWPGMHHEDWRYRDMKAKSGAWYPLVNFFAIHLIPTLIVFACMWPVFYLFQNDLGSAPLLYTGLVVGFVGIALEFFADNTLARFRLREHRLPGQVLDQGLWSRCRHPNYLGEMLFWLGLGLCGLAYQAPWYTMLGAAALWAMFIFVTIPMKERHMEGRYSGYADYQARVPLLFPF